MISIRYAKSFCKRYTEIENYNEAVSSPERWVCHHKLGLIYSSDELVKKGLYFNRPPEEFVFLTKTEHDKIHGFGHKHSKEGRDKLSNTKICTEFGRKYKQITGKSRREDNKAYCREYYYYKKYGKFSWDM